MKFRKATQEEIQKALEKDIKWGWKIQYEHGAIEYLDRRTETGVAHRRHSSGKPFLHNGLVCVRHRGEIEPIDGTFMQAEGTRPIVGLYKLAWLNKYSS